MAFVVRVSTPESKGNPKMKLVHEIRAIVRVPDCVRLEAKPDLLERRPGNRVVRWFPYDYINLVSDGHHQCEWVGQNTYRPPQRVLKGRGAARIGRVKSLRYLSAISNDTGLAMLFEKQAGLRPYARYGAGQSDSVWQVATRWGIGRIWIDKRTGFPTRYSDYRVRRGKEVEFWRREYRGWQTNAPVTVHTFEPKPPLERAE